MCMWDYSMTSRLDPCCNIFYCLYIQMILVICCTHNYFLNPYLLTVILCKSILAFTNSKYLEYLFIWPWLRHICLFGHGYQQQLNNRSLSYFWSTFLCGHCEIRIHLIQSLDFVLQCLLKDRCFTCIVLSITKS